MNSSTLAGERRWASARRSGMTVSGKVFVPKPLNLPSQRLENHGLDPNVEIVPKGTLSWGSRPSSSGSNAWISSASNADGGATSPGHLSGRPSSGGTGTRPSTAGSDRAYEAAANARCSNSRPSSASGSLTSNQTSLTSLRPRSAETRPHSSQLSRFAEPVSEVSVAWGASSTAERLGVRSSKDDGFSLSSVDFPTLGSEKENSTKNAESQDNDRPTSSSGRIGQTKEDTQFHTDARHGITNTWTDSSQSAEDGIYPSTEKWQGEPHQYFKAPSQHFDAWRCPPINSPPGPWYRGYPGGPAFGAPVAPGSFPREPFPYYQPRIPPPAIGGSQAIPSASAGPRRPPPGNGGLYRPLLSDAYTCPAMPFRPGFYHGPPGPPGPMNFEGYYGPPMGYYSNEREFSFPGMSAGPPFYNGYPLPGAPDLANSQGRTTGYGSTGKTLSEPVEADNKGPQKVSPENHNDMDWKEEGENWERDIQSNDLYPGKNSITFRKDGWGADEDADENTFSKRKIPNDNSTRNFEYQRLSSDCVRVKSFEGMGNVREVNDNWTNILPSVTSFSPEMPQPPLTSEINSSLPAATNNSHLMQKLGGLNAKVRVSGGYDAANACNWEEWRRAPEVEVKFNNFYAEVSSTAVSFEKTPVSIDSTSVPHKVVAPVRNKSIHPAPYVFSSYHVAQDRADYCGKGKFNSQDADGWAKKPLATEFSDGITLSTIKSTSNDHAPGPNFVGKTAGISMGDTVGRLEGKSLAEACDLSDIPAQRAKMKELAQQRALQLQKEEEERTREQKAKAFAKLEELNRRTVAVEAVNLASETTLSFSDIQGKQEESCKLGEPELIDPKFHAPHQNLSFDYNIPPPEREDSNNQSRESVEVSKILPLETSQTGQLESNQSSAQPLGVREEYHDANAKKVATQLNEKGISRCDQEGNKQKMKNSVQKSLNERRVANVACEAPIGLANVASNVSLIEDGSSKIQTSGGSNVIDTPDTVAKPLIQQRRKNNSGKNKHKLDETQVLPALSPENSLSNASLSNRGGSVLTMTDPDGGVQAAESSVSLSSLGSSVITVTDPDRGVQDTVVISSLPTEEAHSRSTNQYKHQLSGRTSRNHQSNKFIDKLHGSDTVIWAPVRAQSKAESGTEVSKKLTLEPTINTNSDNMMHDISKGKRAEMQRYVPKLAAKELAQQGSVPAVPFSINSSSSDETPGRGQSGSIGSASLQPVSSATAFVGLEIKECDGRHNKHKEHGTWRQRGSSHMKGVHFEQPSIFELTNDVLKSSEHKFMKPVKNSSAGAYDYPDTSNDATTAVGKTHPANDQGATVRGKQHLHKVYRSMKNYEHRDIFSGETDGSSTISTAPDVVLTEGSVASKDNHILGPRSSSHWQPKSNSKSVNNLQANNTAESETVNVEVTKASKKDHHSHYKVQVPPQHEKRSRNAYQPQTGQSLSESDVSGESIAKHYQELHIEKPSLTKEPPNSPEDVIGSVESAPSANTYVQQDHNSPPPGSRTSGRQNVRSLKSNESRRNWSSQQNNRPNSTPALMQRQAAHYKYRPYKHNKSEKLDGQTDGANNTCSTHSEKNQNHH